jgi:hypothetical protein
MNWSTQKKIRPPIRFATIAVKSGPAEVKRRAIPARRGVLACHRRR